MNPFWSIRIWENFVSEQSLHSSYTNWVYIAYARYWRKDGKWRGL